MRDIDELFTALGRSAFRSRFRLGGEEASYLRQKGMEAIRGHARDFVTARLVEANPANDGRQTPMKKHPVFTAQHATATCCRGCLAKWHRIPTGQPLTEEQIDYVVEVIARWLAGQNVHPPSCCQEDSAEYCREKSFAFDIRPPILSRQRGRRVQPEDVLQKED